MLLLVLDEVPGKSFIGDFVEPFVDLGLFFAGISPIH